MKKGKLIVIEGCDGAGKETQTKMLTENLISKGYWVSSISFPRYDSMVGGRILKYILKSPSSSYFKFSSLKPEVASLFYTADRVESKPDIEKMLEENDFVILDRYYTANLLHQGAKIKDKDERNAFIDMMTRIEIDELKIPKPDLILYLDLPFEIAKSRIEKRTEKGIQKSDVLELDMDYMKNSNEQGKSIADYCKWKVVEAAEEREGKLYECTREEIQAKIVKALNL
jgi:dTMP kinase